ncbi:MAG: CoA transferase, partial [Proteobacteria bacterium]|nr:CoA transferase [Pseudomonadota bacterium]
DLRQGMNDPQVRFREMIIEDAEGNEHIGIPIKFQNEPGAVNFAAPGLGEHNREVALSLGYSDAEVDKLESSGAFC